MNWKYTLQATDEIGNDLITYNVIIDSPLHKRIEEKGWPGAVVIGTNWYYLWLNIGTICYFIQRYGMVVDKEKNLTLVPQEPDEQFIETSEDQAGTPTGEAMGGGEQPT